LLTFGQMSPCSINVHGNAAHTRCKMGVPLITGDMRAINPMNARWSAAPENGLTCLTGRYFHSARPGLYPQGNWMTMEPTEVPQWPRRQSASPTGQPGSTEKTSRFPIRIRVQYRHPFGRSRQ